MAEFIIAFLAGIGTTALWLAAVRAWDDRAYVTDEFKRRVGGDPAPDLYGHVVVDSPMSGEVSSNYAPAIMPTTTTSGSDGAWFMDMMREAAPEEADEFNSPSLEAGPYMTADGRPAYGTPLDEAVFGAPEFNLGEALYGTLSEPSPIEAALEKAPYEFNDEAAPYDPPYRNRLGGGPMTEAAYIAAYGEEAASAVHEEAAPIDPPFPEAPHLEAADFALLDPAPMDTSNDTAYEAALSDALSSPPTDTRASIADFLRSHPTP